MGNQAVPASFSSLVTSGYPSTLDSGDQNKVIGVRSQESALPPAAPDGIVCDLAGPAGWLNSQQSFGFFAEMIGDENKGVDSKSQIRRQKSEGNHRHYGGPAQGLMALCIETEISNLKRQKLCGEGALCYRARAVWMERAAPSARKTLSRPRAIMV